MANYLFMSAPVTGHVHPVLPIAGFLVEAGHQVVWITGRKYQSKVERTGARFHPLPEAMDPKEQEPYDFYPALRKLKGTAQIKYYIKHVFLDNSGLEMEAINQVLEFFPADVLVGDTVTLGLYYKAQLAGMPSLCHSLLPLSIPSRDTAPFGLGLLPGKGMIASFRNRLLNYLINQVAFADVNRYMNQVRQQHGLAPYRLPFFRSMFDLPTITCHLAPTSFEYHRSDLPGSIHFVGPVFPPAEADLVLPHWWDELQTNRPVVLINQGTMATDTADLIEPAIEALQDEDVLVIALPVKPGKLSNLPSNVRTASYIPFAKLLPHVDLMVTNGGYGGTQFALSHGIPLVVAGGKEDKMEVAARVEWSGAGINLRKHQPAPDTIRLAVRRVLNDPSYRQQARRLQQDMARYHAPSQIAQLLEQLSKAVPAYRSASKSEGN